VALVKPCPKCPFRIDVPPFLRRDRAAEIVDSLRGGGEFPCHATLDYETEREDGAGVHTDKTRFCAGALGVFRNEDPDLAGMANQMVRISARLGILTESDVFDPSEVPVFESFDDFVEAQEER
jgi:hypothetical protein